VEAGSVVTIAFTNNDSAPHNVAFYRNERASTEFYVGEIITGPQTVIYTFKAPTLPGVYFFRCDVHAATMTGDFVVTGTAS
jgi:plastocyanin